MVWAELPDNRRYIQEVVHPCADEDRANASWNYKAPFCVFRHRLCRARFPLVHRQWKHALAVWLREMYLGASPTTGKRYYLMAFAVPPVLLGGAVGAIGARWKRRALVAAVLCVSAAVVGLVPVYALFFDDSQVPYWPDSKLMRASGLLQGFVKCAAICGFLTSRCGSRHFVRLALILGSRDWLAG